jgi:hypothetical protein
MSASKFRARAPSAKPRKASDESAKRRQREVSKRLKRLMTLKDEGELKAALAEALNLYPGMIEYEAVLSAWRSAR